MLYSGFGIQMSLYLSKIRSFGRFSLCVCLSLAIALLQAVNENPTMIMIFLIKSGRCGTSRPTGGWKSPWRLRLIGTLGDKGQKWLWEWKHVKACFYCLLITPLRLVVNTLGKINVTQSHRYQRENDPSRIKINFKKNKWGNFGGKWMAVTQIMKDLGAHRTDGESALSATHTGPNTTERWQLAFVRYS